MPHSVGCLKRFTSAGSPVINIRPGSDVARVTFEPSGLVTMYVRTGSPVRFNADTIVLVKRDPAGTCIVTEGRVWFNIGPLWQREQLTTPGVGMKNLRPRRSDSVCPSGSAGGGPPPAKICSAADEKSRSR